MDELPLEGYHQQQGAPDSMEIRDYMNLLLEIWFGRNEMIHWLTKSPDLTPSDFYWRRFKKQPF